MKNRDRFGRPEGEIEPRDTLSPVGLNQLMAGMRIRASKDISKLVFADLALESEIGGARCEPVAGGLAGAEVVVLDAAGDRVQVVELTALAELPDVENLATRPSSDRFEG